MAEKKKSIEIAIPNRESEAEMCADLSRVLQSLESPDTEESYQVNVNFSYLQPVDANRNKMVKEFLDKPEAEWLLMIDSDVAPPTDILSMIEYGEPVISAVVTIKKEGVPRPLLLKKRKTQYGVMTLDELEEKINDSGIVSVDGVGTGCLLMHRDVLEKMEPPWFQFVYNEYGGLQLGEDFYFSRKLEEQDVTPKVSTNHVCSHYRKVDLTEFLKIVTDAKQEAQNYIEETKEGLWGDLGD